MDKLWIAWHINDACNFRCDYCPRSHVERSLFRPDYREAARCFDVLPCLRMPVSVTICARMVKFDTWPRYGVAYFAY